MRAVGPYIVAKDWRHDMRLAFQMLCSARANTSDDVQAEPSFGMAELKQVRLRASAAARDAWSRSERRIGQAVAKALRLSQ